MFSLNEKQILYIVGWLVASGIGYYFVLDWIMSLPPYPESEERLYFAIWIFPSAGLIGMIIAYTVHWFK
tara:strand:+ start:794 stop:1000 length:207 start_codon:yes stop_codon:yes gene_type:complete